VRDLARKRQQTLADWLPGTQHSTAAQHATCSTCHIVAASLEISSRQSTLCRAQCGLARTLWALLTLGLGLACRRAGADVAHYCPSCHPGVANTKYLLSPSPCSRVFRVAIPPPPTCVPALLSAMPPCHLSRWPLAATLHESDAPACPATMCDNNCTKHARLGMN